MRNPIDVLKLLTEKASVKEYRFERLYRNLCNPDFYLLAYKNIAASQGSMTAGADGMTIDNMSMARINKIINSLKDQTYQPNPARRTYIAKKNNPSKERPLGIPSTNDKLLQEIIRMLWRPSINPLFPTCLMASAPSEAATRRCPKSRTLSQVFAGWWRATSRLVLIVLTTMFSSIFYGGALRTKRFCPLCGSF